eukprot:1155616-Pelagomonas_calceolata.AAC.5
MATGDSGRPLFQGSCCRHGGKGINLDSTPRSSGLGSNGRQVLLGKDGGQVQPAEPWCCPDVATALNCCRVV